MGLFWLLPVVAVILVALFWPRGSSGLHSHKCDCGNVWVHGDEAFGDEAAHTCEKCGSVEWWVYRHL